MQRNELATKIIEESMRITGKDNFSVDYLFAAFLNPDWYTATYTDDVDSDARRTKLILSAHVVLDKNGETEFLRMLPMLSAEDVCCMTLQDCLRKAEREAREEGEKVITAAKILWVLLDAEPASVRIFRKMQSRRQELIAKIIEEESDDGSAEQEEVPPSEESLNAEALNRELEEANALNEGLAAVEAKMQMIKKMLQSWENDSDGGNSDGGNSDGNDSDGSYSDGGAKVEAHGKTEESEAAQTDEEDEEAAEKRTEEQIRTLLQFMDGEKADEKNAVNDRADNEESADGEDDDDDGMTEEEIDAFIREYLTDPEDREDDRESDFLKRLKEDFDVFDDDSDDEDDDEDEDDDSDEDEEETEEEDEDDGGYVDPDLLDEVFEDLIDNSDEDEEETEEDDEDEEDEDDDDSDEDEEEEEPPRPVSPLAQRFAELARKQKEIQAKKAQEAENFGNDEKAEDEEAQQRKNRSAEQVANARRRIDERREALDMAKERKSKLLAQFSIFDSMKEEFAGPALTDDELLTASDFVRDLSEDMDGGYQDEHQKKGLMVLHKAITDAKNIRSHLSARIFGQDHAVATFTAGIFRMQLDIAMGEKKKTPRAVFLFVGSPGTGKTFLAEEAAEALKLPYRRFDMSEYADKEAHLQFAGSDKVYKNGQEGLVTSFVRENPKCVLLFDEVEKCHMVVTRLFLQILDAGRLRDCYTTEEVSFADCIMIFTTNAGRMLYDDPEVTDLSTVSNKTILRALETDINPVTNEPFFPQAICSRFSTGNVILFNRLTANHLLHITDDTLQKYTETFGENLKLRLSLDENISKCILYREGANADARTVRAKAENFCYTEVFELFRFLFSESYLYKPGRLRDIRIGAEIPEDEEIYPLFHSPDEFKVLIFATGETERICRNNITNHGMFYADTMEDAVRILDKEDISIVLCDILCKSDSESLNVLNLEDVHSVGQDFFRYVAERRSIPVYLLQTPERTISNEEFYSFAALSARGILSLRQDDPGCLNAEVFDYCHASYQQKMLLRLARMNKVLTFSSSQSVSPDGKHAFIRLFDFKLSLAVDAEDGDDVLKDVSRPTTRFDDVIGARDAKKELTYFVDFLKDPVKFMRRGARPPKGILLYGPPGTGKTMLAKAMAGESNVTFISAEGNQFIQQWAGKGAQSVHQLFSKARKYAPSVLFIDEIDAVAMDRKDGSPSSDILTSFLTEMDGFKSNPDRPVFVLAATNYSPEAKPGEKSLDPALLRRFDRRILVDLPVKEERRQYVELLQKKNRNVRLSAEEIDSIVLRSIGMSLAELESVMELALRNAFRKEDGIVDDEVFEEAFELFNNGDKKDRDEATQLRTARHEAGHALLSWAGGERPSYVTIVSRGNFGGYMQYADTEKKTNYTKAELLSRIRCALGGRAAEMVYYGKKGGISTGAGADLANATEVATQMLCTFGMDEKAGLASVDSRSLFLSPHYQKVHTRVNRILNRELRKAKAIIFKNRKKMDKMVEELLAKNRLKEDEIAAILDDNPSTER